MARRSRMSILKRQRELKKSEKAARKRAKRHGISEPLFQEPTPTVVGGMFGGDEDSDEDDERETTLEPSESDHDNTQ